MRNFLPIKGPGGRALTPKEKVALCVLGVTLVLCALTMLAGERAYAETDARNPVFAAVAVLCRAFGGGIVGFYALVLIWSGLIYFKGERIADVAPVSGRLLAGFGVLIGISGALGIGNVATAGALGSLVGGALGNTLGGTLGIAILLALMLLGTHLASQGAWGALREPAPAVSRGYASPTSLESSGGRVSHEPPFPDDGDPSPDERTNAVTLAVEEIERSQGVTIVDVEPTNEPETDSRPSIGEEVESAPTPEAGTEEAEVQRGLREVSEALARETQRDAEPDIDDPLAPAPPEHSDAVETESSDEVEADPGYYEPTYEILERVPEPEPEETGFAATPAATGQEDEDEEHDASDEEFADRSDFVAHEEEEEDEVEEVDDESEPEEDNSDDPYARGGLIKRLRQRTEEESQDASRPYASFDWRGRPLD